MFVIPKFLCGRSIRQGVKIMTCRYNKIPPLCNKNLLVPSVSLNPNDFVDQKECKFQLKHPVLSKLILSTLNII